MTDQEKKVIVDYADGNNALREEAIEIYRCDVLTTGHARGTPEKDWMAEVDNVCPDLGLRFASRQALLKARGRK